MFRRRTENLSISAGAAQPNLSTKQIKEIRLPVPKIVEQLAFLEKIDALERETQALQSHYRTKLADIDQLRQSLLQKAFAGELS